MIAKCAVTPPDGLDTLQMDPTGNVLISGGLRLGRRQAWIRGAAPTVMVAGLEVGEAPMIDGMAVGVGQDGTLQADERLAESGMHTIEVGTLRRRVEIVEPSVSEHAQRPISTTEETVALPAGRWVLLGDRPDQVAYPACEHWGGVLATCPFNPYWAIDVGAGHGATVLCLSQPPPPLTPQRVRITRRNRRQCSTWATRIYDAHVRRPRLGAVRVELQVEYVRRRWAEYAVAAKAVKRALRKLP